jgi:hypothetical protein
MALNNSNEKVADPKYQNWSYQPITFSRADQWANILELGNFPLVLDPIIRNVRFEKVLIDGGYALDILFRNALSLASSRKTSSVTTHLSGECSWGRLSQNRPNYKSTSPKTIAEAIKFLNLSKYNSGSPQNHEGFQTKPRATKTIVIQQNTALVTIVHK